MEIHQIVVSASPADAVGQSAFTIRSLLRRVGHSEIFARYRHQALADQVHLLEEYETLPSARNGNNILIYHAAIGEPDVVSYLLNRPERLLLVYHNITPPEFFRGLDPRFALTLLQGRMELEELRNRVEVAFAPSDYNARELESLGYRDVRVTPLILDVDALAGGDPDPAMTERLENGDGPLVLFVGQQLPHKRHHLTIQAFHLLATHFLPESRLALVGAAHLPWYRRALDELVRELNLDRVLFLGRISVSELVAAYRAADLFVTLSEHEGVCVPLIESMTFGLPVMARAYGAIPETMGDAGLLLPAESGAPLVAEGMAEVLQNEDLRSTFIRRGYERLPIFDPDLARASFLEHLAAVV